MFGPWFVVSSLRFLVETEGRWCENFFSKWKLWIEIDGDGCGNVRLLVCFLIRKCPHRSPSIFCPQVRILVEIDGSKYKNGQWVKIFRKLNFLVGNWRWCLWKCTRPGLLCRHWDLHLIKMLSIEVLNRNYGKIWEKFCWLLANVKEYFIENLQIFKNFS